MKYDFTTLPDRHGRDSIAVDGLGKGFAPDAPQPGFDAIPHVGGGHELRLPAHHPAGRHRAGPAPASVILTRRPNTTAPSSAGRTTRNDVTGLTAEAIGYENGVLGGALSSLTSHAAPATMCSTRSGCKSHFPCKNSKEPPRMGRLFLSAGNKNRNTLRFAMQSRP